MKFSKAQKPKEKSYRIEYQMYPSKQSNLFRHFVLSKIQILCSIVYTLKY